jgi:TolB protein
MMLGRWTIVTVVCAMLCVGMWTAPEPPSAGGRIAFLRLSSVYWQLWSMAPDGSSQEQLTDSPVDKVHAAWRPGTTELLYHTNRGETFVLDLKTGNERQILQGTVTRDAVWSPEGDRLAFSVSPNDEYRGESTVWVSAPDGSNQRQIAVNMAWTAAPAWLGKNQILYTRSVMLPSFEQKHDLWMVELDNEGEPRPMELDDEPQKLDVTVFFGNERPLIAYRSLRSGFYEIWTCDLAAQVSNQVSHLKSYAGNPSWSPDGKALAFESETRGMVQLYRISVDGTGLVQITHGDVPSRKPEWFAFDESISGEGTR